MGHLVACENDLQNTILTILTIDGKASNQFACLFLSSVVIHICLKHIGLRVDTHRTMQAATHVIHKGAGAHPKKSVRGPVTEAVRISMLTM